MQISAKIMSGLRQGLVMSAAFTALSSLAMDTDIFTATSSAGTPNVLIVIDNTSNWSRNDEKFPDGSGGTITQGQAEVAAISTVLNSLTSTTNIGLMEFATAGNANDTGGYVRQAIVPMGASGTPATNKGNFQTKLSTIYGNITSPTEKINSGTQYGDLMWDVYNYFTGGVPSVRSAAVPSTLADATAYTTQYTQFKAPVSSADMCAPDNIIFIGNPPASGPTKDTATNTAALTADGGAFSQLALPPYAQTTTMVPTNLGYTSACYASAPTGTPSSTDYPTCPGGTNATYDSCVYSATDSQATMNACSSGQSRYNVIATTPNTSASSTVVSSPTTATGTTACYASAVAASGVTGGLTCPANTSTTVGNTITTTSYSCSYAIGAVTGSACSPTVVVTQGTSLIATATTSTCYANDSSRGNDNAGLICPVATSSTNGGVTTATSYTCSYSAVAGSNSSCSPSSKSKFIVTQHAAPTITTTSTNAHYVVTKTQTMSVTTATAASGSTVATLGNSSACYSSAPAGTPTEYSCPAGASCSYSGTTSNAQCPSGKVYQVVGNLNTIVTVPTGGTPVTDTATYNADEWARFLNTHGFPVSGATTNAHIRTHTIDVYGAKPNGVQSSLLSNMAHYGGGGYYTATNPAAITAALQNIFAEINAKDSVFASAALPISAGNRSQNGNEVYIGLFRPDPQSLPRWMGNLKRYQLGSIGSFTALVDKSTPPIAAINTSTGFLTPCAQSWWTSDTGNYWGTVAAGVVTPRVFFTHATDPGLAWTTLGDDTALATSSICSSATAYSDLPDGPIVEKGGAAQRLRNASSRKVLTLSGSSIVDFNTTNVTSLSANSTVNANIVNFITGHDVTGEINGAASSSWRPSIHGAVIHSRPEPVDFGGSNGVKIYYGSNDGTFRAVDAATGNEDWAFVPPESYSSLQRLLDNSPSVKSPSPTPPLQTAAAGAPQSFYFDGSTGVYQSGIGSGTKTWIFPSMRRGGRMVYAFDVSDPTLSPIFKWKAGCPNQTGTSGCADGTGANPTTMARIGQTWSTPSAVFLPGYSTSKPVLVVGGGYDTCDDTDNLSSGCASSPLGAGVYVLDADTGALIQFFATSRSVAADVALIDANLDGVVDFAYAADTGGNIYRINFSSPATFQSLPPTATPTAAPTASQWTLQRVAYTNDAANPRKFLFPPALAAINKQVYIAIGSGDREHPTAMSYPYTSPVLNRAYVYRDDLASSAYNLDSLTNNTPTNTCAAAGLQSAGNKGWLLDLNAQGVGEQSVTTALISAGLVFFSTNRPTPGLACGTSLGEARGYALNLFNGSGGIGVTPSCGGVRSSIFVGGGLPPSPVTGVVTINGVVQNVIIGAAPLDDSNCGALCGQKLNPTINKKRTRIYWKTNTDTK